VATPKSPREIITELAELAGTLVEDAAVLPDEDPDPLAVVAPKLPVAPVVPDVVLEGVSGISAPSSGSWTIFVAWGVL